MQRILVVEDDPDVSELFVMALTDYGHYEAITAQSGNAAVPLLELHRPDLALIDVGIPGVPGLEVGGHALVLDVPVVLMTGDFVRSSQLTASGVPYLLKPFQLSELIEAVGRELARAEQNRRELRRSLARLNASKAALVRAHEDAARTVAAIRREHEDRQLRAKAKPK